MLSTVLQPLNNLHVLRANVTFKWNKECDSAFKKCKNLITSNRILTHYELQLPFTLACDASSYGIGAVISHKLPNGKEKPISFASKTLDQAQHN